MRILYLVPYVPTPIRVRPYSLLQALAGREHEIVLATVWENNEEEAWLEQMRAQDIEVIARHLEKWRAVTNAASALASSYPMQARYSWQPHLAEALAVRLLEKPVDVIHVEHLRGAEYGRFLQMRLAQYGLRIPIVWDSVDCISYLFRQAAGQSKNMRTRLMAWLELARTKRYEAKVADSFDRVLVTSAIDRDEIVALSQEKETSPPINSRIQVVPNGVDLEYFGFRAAPRVPDMLVFTGKMSYHANVAAAEYLAGEIMPLIWQHRPEMQLWIVGKDPTPAVCALATVEAPLMGPDAQPGVQSNALPPRAVVVTGTVPDIRPYLWQAGMVAAPILYGAGIQNKILEAMACGAPIVATQRAGVALQAQAGKQYMAADTAQEFAQSVLHLAGNAALRREMAIAARQYVDEFHSWNSAVSMLEGVYSELIGSVAQAGQAGVRQPMIDLATA